MPRDGLQSVTQVVIGPPHGHGDHTGHERSPAGQALQAQGPPEGAGDREVVISDALPTPPVAYSTCKKKVQVSGFTLSISQERRSAEFGEHGLWAVGAFCHTVAEIQTAWIERISPLILCYACTRAAVTLTVDKRCVLRRVHNSCEWGCLGRRLPKTWRRGPFQMFCDEANNATKAGGMGTSRLRSR